MKIDIAKTDLLDLRDALYMAKTHGRYLQSGNAVVPVVVKVMKKLNRAIKEVYGHDCNGSYYTRMNSEYV